MSPNWKPTLFGFRGDCCPGLIEAGSLGPPGRTGRARVSGAIVAPASLKRVEASAFLRLDHVSGAIVAPASLKQYCEPKKEDNTDGFRGDCCPGLIEARRQVENVDRDALVSGAIVAPASLKHRQPPLRQLRRVEFPGRLLPRPH